MFYPNVKVPVLQNRVFDSEKLAIDSDFGHLQIGQDLETGIFENRLFEAPKMFTIRIMTTSSQIPGYLKRILTPYAKF